MLSEEKVRFVLMGLKIEVSMLDEIWSLSDQDGDDQEEIEEPKTELEEEEQVEEAIKLSLEAGKIVTILSFLSLSLLKVKLLKLMLRQRKDS